MAERKDPLQQLVRRIGKDLGNGASAERFDQQRSALESLVAAGGPERRTRPWLWGGAVAASLLVATLTWLAWPESTELTYTFADQEYDAGTEDWLQGGPDHTLHFDDGSAIALRPDTSLRVAESSRDRVDLMVSRGRVEADIDSAGDTTWTLDVGLYRVVVVGTVFQVEWDPTASVLDVWVTEGIVRVYGEGLTEHGVEISAGQHLRADGTRSRLALAPAGDAVADEQEPRAPVPPTAPRGGRHDLRSPEVESLEVPAAPDVSEPITPAEVVVPPVDAPWLHWQEEPVSEPPVIPQPTEPLAYVAPAAVTPPPVAAVPSWQRLASDGQYAAAVRAAEAEGIEGVLGDADALALWQLAEAARYSGEVTLSTRALERYRERFGDQDRAPTAAFLLGRIAQEQRGEAAVSAAWFGVYLDEAPGGPLAEEALGRMMVAHDDAGQASLAQQAAQGYLALYPDGSFAAAARSLTSEED